MLSDTKTITALLTKHLGNEFHIEMIPLTSQSRDPFEKKTKNRFDLRTALYSHLKDKKNFVFEDALDLRNVPQKIGTPDGNYYSSLSHTEDLGVFVLDSSPVGVDYEKIDKVKTEIVERVCSKEELKLNLNFRLLWSIKESAFKAIPFIVQPKVITDITVTNITSFPRSASKGFESFSFTADLKKASTTKIEGICLANATHQLSVAKAFIKK